MSGGDVAVPELGMKDEPFFGPVGIQRLVGFKAFIAQKGVILLCLDERGVHVEGGGSAGFCLSTAAMRSALMRSRPDKRSVKGG